MPACETAGKLGAVAPELEEPIVIHYYRLARQIATAVRVHPNIITLGRLALMGWLTWAFYKRRHVIAAALALQVCFFLDHLDGEMARTHNLVTPFGDYLDHILDALYTLPLLYLIGRRVYRKKAFWPVVATLAVAVLLSSLLIACQEIVLLERSPKNASASLAVARKTCPRWLQAQIPWLRHAGMGMLHLVIGGLMIYVSSTS